MQADDEHSVPVDALRRLRAAVRAGLGPRRKDPTPDRRSGNGDPALLGDAVRGFLADHGLEQRHGVARVLGDWPALVGAEVAEHVQVEEFADGELTLRADSTAWANQMRLLSATVQRRLDEQLGADVVQSIRVLGPEAPTWKHGNRRIPGRGPRDTYG